MKRELTVIVVGPSNSGKSTLAHLIQKSLKNTNPEIDVIVEDDEPEVQNLSQGMCAERLDTIFKHSEEPCCISIGTLSTARGNPPEYIFDPGERVFLDGEKTADHTFVSYFSEATRDEALIQRPHRLGLQTICVSVKRITPLLFNNPKLQEGMLNTVRNFTDPSACIRCGLPLHFDKDHCCRPKHPTLKLLESKIIEKVLQVSSSMVVPEVDTLTVEHLGDGLFEVCFNLNPQVTPKVTEYRFAFDDIVRWSGLPEDASDVDKGKAVDVFFEELRRIDHSKEQNEPHTV